MHNMLWARKANRRVRASVKTQTQSLTESHNTHKVEDTLSYSSPQSFTTANGKIIAAVDMVTITTGVKPNSSFIRFCKPPTHKQIYTHTSTHANRLRDRQSEREGGGGGGEKRTR